MDLIHARYFDGGDILGQPGVRGVSISAGTNDTELRFSARVFVTRERVRSRVQLQPAYVGMLKTMHITRML